MPELPEVYTITNSLNKEFKNQVIKDYQITESRIFQIEDYNDLFANIINSKLLKIERKGKRMIFFFDNSIWIISLGMTGKFLIKDKELSLNNYINNFKDKHDMLILEFNNKLLVYNDVRKFGKFNFFNNEEEANNFLDKKVGVDALEEFSDKTLKEKLGDNKILKASLLEQERIAGIGNYLADEICFDAKLHPKSNTSNLSDKDFNNLNKSIKKIINKSIKYNGVSISDYLTPDNQKGNMQDYLKVYGHKGKECVDCGNILEKTVIATRGTVYCSNCQKLK